MNIGIYSRNNSVPWDSFEFKSLMVSYLCDLSAVGEVFYWQMGGPLNTVPQHPKITPMRLTKSANWPLKTPFFQRILWRRALKKHPMQTLLVFDAADFINGPISQMLILSEAQMNVKTSSQLKKFQTIIVSSEAQRQELMQRYGVSGQRIIVVAGLRMTPVSISYGEKQGFKSRTTAGQEFFLLCGPLSAGELTGVLKSFSQFKLMQQSGWKLVLAMAPGAVLQEEAQIESLLSTYKYRQDVHIYKAPDANSFQTAIAASYVSISLATGLGFPLKLATALSLGVPVLAPEELKAHFNAGGMAFFDTQSPNGLSAHLMDMYKNEVTRQKLALATKNNQEEWDPTEGLQQVQKRLLQA